VVAFTARAIAWFAQHGAIVERIMTDNGSAYKSFAFRYLLGARGIKHKRTRPYTPRTNGKADRFIKTSLREWAYAQPFHSSADRAAAMPIWIDTYNRRRPIRPCAQPRRSTGSLRGTPPHPPHLSPHPIPSQASSQWTGSSIAQRPPQAAWA
jgi:transposase InsO family protein